ncbi:MAG: hypothetical protein FWE80_02810 [Oscillospiraceae bacterium]|nr:hypothetical protein [Oscillospiraceae bacterium]
MKMKHVWAFLGVWTVAILVIGAVIGFFVTVFFSRPPETKAFDNLSPDGQYILMESTGADGYFRIYSIINKQNNIIYTTPTWYAARGGLLDSFYVEGMWALKNNDFFVISNDVGLILYSYEKGSWKNKFTVDILTNPDGTEYAVITKWETEREKEVVQDYDIDNLPERVKEYLYHVYEMMNNQ